MSIQNSDAKRKSNRNINSEMANALEGIGSVLIGDAWTCPVCHRQTFRVHGAAGHCDDKCLNTRRTWLWTGEDIPISAHRASEPVPVAAAVDQVAVATPLETDRIGEDLIEVAALESPPVDVQEPNEAPPAPVRSAETLSMVPRTSNTISIHDAGAVSGVCETLDVIHGVKARPGAKCRCPQCGHQTLSVKSDGTLAKCFHPSCGWYLTPHHDATQSRKGVYGILFKIFLDCRGALEKQRQSGQKGDGWRYLTDERQIHPDVLGVAMVGAVPVQYGETVGSYFEPLIADIRKRLDLPAKGRPAKERAGDQRTLAWLEETKDKAAAIFTRAGWITLFYTDEHHRITSVKIRKPYAPKGDKDRIKILKPFPSAGVFGHGVFTPFEGHSESAENGLIIVEGDFNALSLWSAETNYGGHISAPPKYHRCIAIGGGSSGDFQCVKRISEGLDPNNHGASPPLYIYDNDDAGRSSRDRMNELMHLETLTTPGADSDLDSFIREAGTDPSAVMQALRELLKLRAFSPRPMACVAAEVDAVRKCRNGDHREKWEIDRDVAEVICRDLRGRGTFYSYLGDAYFFSAETKKLIAIHNKSSELIQLLHHFGVNASEKLFAYVTAAMYAEALENGTPTTFHRLAHYDQDTHTLYVTRHDGNVYRITKGSVVLVDNGTDGVLFMQDRSATPYRYDPTLIASGESVLKSLLFSQARLSPPQQADTDPTTDDYEELLEIWLYAIFFSSVMKTKPILVLHGEKGSQKSTTARKIGLLLYGEHFDVSQVPDKSDDAEALLSNSRFAVLDNADSFKPWLENLLAVVSTSGTIPRRKFYTTNDLIDFPLNCYVAITTRTPYFQRDDVADRCLILKTYRPDTFKPESAVQYEFLSNRDRMMTELFGALQAILAALENTSNEETSFRLADFSSFCLRMAQSQGEDSEKRWRSVFSKIGGEQQRFSLKREEWLITVLQTWANDMTGTEINSDRFVTNYTLHKELVDMARAGNITFEYADAKDARRFATKMGILRPSMQSIHFNIETKQEGGHRTSYRYSPIEPEETACLDAK